LASFFDDTMIEIDAGFTQSPVRCPKIETFIGYLQNKTLCYCFCFCCQVIRSQWNTLI